MGILDDIATKLGGKQGQEGGLASLQKLFNSSGGLQGITSKLTNHGGGQQVQSWVGSGQNQPMSAQQVQQVMDPNQIHDMAQKAGISDQEASEQVAKAMPEMVNQATPQGQIPSQDPFTKGLDSLKKMFKM
jgi:uncharacterized protein YidB (DUF937 family)